MGTNRADLPKSQFGNFLSTFGGLRKSPAPRERLPPADLVAANGIGIGDHTRVLDEFSEIGAGLVSEMIHNGFVHPDDRVLDLGCGLGRLARPLAKFLSTRGRYEGIDIVGSSIEWCSENYADLPNFRFQHADLFSTSYNTTATMRPEEYRFPFATDSFDFVFSTSLFTHMEIAGVGNYLSEIARVLKPGGATWNTYFLLDEISIPLAALPDRPNTQMRFPVDGGLVVVPHNPEAAIALYTDRVASLHDAHRLTIVEIRNGPWSGRSDNLRASYQDVVIARKA
jgi:SAM-dependent methyltransferase